jgi:[acyl-carrier-protein] S-malonyltransferase
VTATDGHLPVAFLLPGQGSQHHRMAAGLYGRYEEFSASMDMIFALLGADGAVVREDWLSPRPRVSVDHVTRSQILLFAVDYALGVQLREWGVHPRVLLGHSVGEVAAAALSGVFELRDAVALMWDRIRRLARAPAGAMIAVAASREQVTDVLAGDVVIGAVNGPRQVVLSGPVSELGQAADRLRAAGITVFPVAASTAFHSPMLAEVAAGAVPEIARIPVRPPAVSIVSGYTAAPLTYRELADPHFWARHPVAPVLFWPALDALLSAGQGYRLVEVGPGQGLATVARRHPAVLAGRSTVRAALPARPRGDEADRDALERLADELAVVVRP